MSAQDKRVERTRRGPYSFSEAELLHLESGFDEVVYLEELHRKAAEKNARERRHPCIGDEPRISSAQERYDGTMR